MRRYVPESALMAGEDGGEVRMTNNANSLEEEKTATSIHATPAVVVAAFGSSRKGKYALDLFHEQLVEYFSSYPIYWGFTSTFICRKTGQPLLQQTLASVAEDGHRQAVVLPLQLFPGSEYRNIVAETGRHPGLTITVAETLMHRWQYVDEVLKVVEKDFLEPSEGVNLLALHGTPQTGDPVNIAYHGVAEIVAGRYSNVKAAALEGLPDHQTLFARMKRIAKTAKNTRLRLMPLMFTAGMHVAEDLMGEGNSWQARLSAMGFEVECPVVQHNGESYYKSLAAYPEIHALFLQRLKICLQQFE